MDRRVVVVVLVVGGLTTLSHSHHIIHMEAIGVTGRYRQALWHIGNHTPLLQVVIVERCIVLIRSSFSTHSPSFLPISPPFISLLRISIPPLQYVPILHPHSLLSLPSPSTSFHFHQTLTTNYPTLHITPSVTNFFFFSWGERIKLLTASLNGNGSFSEWVLAVVNLFSQNTFNIIKLLPFHKV